MSEANGYTYINDDVRALPSEFLEDAVMGRIDNDALHHDVFDIWGRLSLDTKCDACDGRGTRIFTSAREDE